MLPPSLSHTEGGYSLQGCGRYCGVQEKITLDLCKLFYEGYFGKASEWHYRMSKEMNV